MYLLIDILVIFLVNLLCLLPGLKKQKYYITTGYGLSVSCDAVCIFILCLIARPLNWLEYFKQGFIFHFLLLIIYGYRLAHFLYKRSFNSNYNAKVKEFKSVSWSISVAMMLSCAAIYLCMTSSLFVDGRSLTQGYSTNYVIKFAGIVIMICGLVVESVADSQKTFYKESNPDLFVPKDCTNTYECLTTLEKLPFGLVISSPPLLRRRNCSSQYWVCLDSYSLFSLLSPLLVISIRSK